MTEQMTEPVTEPVTEHGGPLDGIVVLDLARVLAGPLTAMMLADLGARVIKVERPGAGDDTRSWGPPFVGEEDPQSTYFLALNRNKESIALDLTDPADREVLLGLVARADVLVENFRPGVMDRLGLSREVLEEVNPRLVSLSISGFGVTGPDSDRPGYDQILQGEAGLMSMTGTGPDAPVKVGVPVGDVMAGLVGTIGILAAIVERVTSGRGQGVSTSLLAALINAHTFQGTRHLIGGEIPVAEGNFHPTVAPYGAFATADGMIQIAVGNDAIWQRFAPLVGLDPEDADYRDNRSRMAHRERLHEQILQAFGKHPSADLLELLRDAGVPAGEVRSLDQVYRDPHILAEGLVVEVEDDQLGTLRLPGPPLRFSRSGQKRHTAPPRLDADGDDVRGWMAAGQDGGPRLAPAMEEPDEGTT